MKKLIVLLTCFMAGAASYAQTNTNQKVIEKAFKALQNKDLQSLQSCLAEECTLAGLDPKTTIAVLPQVVGKFAGFSNFSVVSESKELDNTRVQVKLDYLTGTSGHPNVLLNAQHQIVELNIIKKPQLQQPAGNVLPAKVTLPFRLLNSCIYVEGTLNGKKGLYMIDSGAFGLVMNQGLFSKSIDTVNYGRTISGVNGKVPEAAGVTVNELNVANIHLSGIKAIAIPMEKEVGETGLANFGLLGYSLLSHYSLSFDYSDFVLCMNKVDSLGNEQNPDSAAFFSKVHFEMQRHLPVITVMVNAIAYRFALDCGASHNIIYHDFNQWQDVVTDQHMETLSGIDGREEAVTTGQLKKLRVGDLDFNDMATAFTPNRLYTASTKEGLKIDGLLGYPFFSAYKMKINYQKREMYFYKK